MHISEVRNRLREACDKAGSQIAWARVHDLNISYVSEVQRGTRAPGSKVLAALGLVRVIDYVEIDKDG